MNCEEALDIVLDDDTLVDPLQHARAEAHVAECRDCQHAVRACAALGLERIAEPPPPPPGARERAIRAAVRAHAPAERESESFVRGLVAGAAIAASVTAIVIGVLSRPEPPAPVPPAVTPQITMALNESRPVNISLDAVSAMPGTMIRVLVSGDVELDGYAGQRELRWTTDLEAGSNQLTIPVVAIGAGGGQLLVEVEHDMRQRRFLVDIAGAG